MKNRLRPIAGLLLLGIYMSAASAEGLPAGTYAKDGVLEFPETAQHWIWPPESEPAGSLTVQTGNPWATSPLCEIFKVTGAVRIADPRPESPIELRRWTIRLDEPSRSFLLSTPRDDKIERRIICARDALMREGGFCGAGGWYPEGSSQRPPRFDAISLKQGGGPLFLVGQCTKFRVEDVSRTLSTPENITLRHHICATKQPERARLGDELINKSGIYLECAFDRRHPAHIDPNIGPLMHVLADD